MCVRIPTTLGPPPTPGLIPLACTDNREPGMLRLTAPGIVMVVVVVIVVKGKKGRKVYLREGSV